MAKGRAPKDFVPDHAGDVGVDFELWLEDVNDYLEICGVSDNEDKKRLFLNLGGLAVRKVVKGLVIPAPPGATVDNPGDTYKALTDAVQAHFRPCVNTTSERHKFRQLRQLPDETVSSFVGRLRERAELCQFESTAVDTVANTQVRDQLLTGLKSPEIRRDLLKEPKLSLHDAVTKAVALEVSFADSKLYDDNATSGHSSIAAMSDRPRSAMPKRTAGPPGKAGPACKYCGRSHARGVHFCPAAKAKCHACGKTGHFSCVRQSSKAHAVEDSSPPSESAQYIYESAYTCSDGMFQRQGFTVTLMVNGKPCSGLLDTGATRTILTDDVVAATRPSNRVLRAYNGGDIETLGMADVRIGTEDQQMDCECFVVPCGKRRVLFGQDVIAKLELLVSANSVNTTPVSISVDPAAKPLAQPARRPPFSAKDDIEKELERLVKAQIIEPVKEASAWVSPIVPVRKSNGKLRLCVDYRQLNKCIVRERHSVPTVDEITAELEGATVFSVLDAESGFHQLLLDEESQPLTTFATHCGLFRFKRLPFGVSCAPEIFQRVVSDILSGLPGVVVYIDDILVFGCNRAEHDERLANVRARLDSANLRLNLEKCCIGQEQVKYLGHILTKDGVQPDGDKLSAIQDMAPPQSVADVQRFLGMVTYLGKFVPQLTTATEPLCSLVKREPFRPDDDLLKAFEAVKQAMVSSQHTLAYFRASPSVPTAVSCDASPSGLGAILWQRSNDGRWLPVTCASRTLTDVETRYSQMEREMLCIVFALTRFRQYVLGRHVEVYTDHKPLLPIVQKPFDEVPPRLQRWLVSLMPYDYALKYVPGKQLACTDALSRAPVPASEVSAAESRSLHEYVGLVLEASPVCLEEIRTATKDDAVLHTVMQRVLTSTWHEPSSLEQPFYLVRDQLTVVDGVLLFAARFVIPEGLRHSVLALAHEGHPGQDAFQDSLRQRVWWPGLTKDASLFLERCSVCWRRRNNGPQELLPTEIVGVWEKVAVDIVTIEGRSLLSMIDYGSRFPILRPLLSTTSSAIIDELEDIFTTFGLPSTLVSDNGPQFVSEHMSTFLSRLGITHTRSSPRYARSNGMVERLHRLVRERMSALKPHLSFRRRLNQVLMDIRNSQHRMLGMSPSEALFRQPLRTRVPTFMVPRIVNPEHQLQAKATMAENHDSRRGVRHLPQLSPGDAVIIQDGYCDPSRPWTVVQQYGRQVGVTNGSRMLLRNRQHVREYRSPAATSVQDAVSSQSNSAKPSKPVVSLPSPPSKPTEPVPIASSPSESGEPAKPDLLSKPVTTEDSLPCRLDAAPPVECDRPPPELLFRDGLSTKSGRVVKFTAKAKAAFQ